MCMVNVQVLLKMEFPSKIEPMRWPVVILVHTFMESKCWLCPGHIVCGLSSSDTCQLWKFKMPSLVKLHSFISRSLLCWPDLWHTDGAAIGGRWVRDFVSAGRSTSNLHVTWQSCCLCNLQFTKWCNIPSLADTILALNLDSIQGHPNILPQLVCRHFVDDQHEAQFLFHEFYLAIRILSHIPPHSHCGTSFGPI
jgi:hypothetical protein